VAGRQGGGREIIRDNEGEMRDNEYNSETNKQKNRFEEGQVAPGMRPAKGHLAPEVKMANDKLYPYTRISVNLSKWYIRKAPFVLRAQPLDLSLLVTASLLNKLAS
jgi:hypothetical protein